MRPILCLLAVLAGCSPKTAQPIEPAPVRIDESAAPEAAPDPEPVPEPEPAPEPVAPPEPVVVAEPLPEVGDDEVAAFEAELTRRKATMIAPRQIVVKMDDCARLPVLPDEPSDMPPDDVIQSEGGTGRCFTFFSVSPLASFTDEPYLAWAIGVSKLDGVETVFVCEWQEEGETGYWTETYAELREGRVVDTGNFDLHQDRKFRRIKTDRAAQEHMWKRWPLSEVARQMGYESRAPIVHPRSVVLMGGREFPPDTAGFERTLYGFMSKKLIDQLEACAGASDLSSDAWIDAQAKAIGEQRLVELGRKPRLEGERRAVEVALSDAAYELLARASVEADCSLSHIVQHMVTTHCAP